jgi:hypothetical protein
MIARTGAAGYREINAVTFVVPILDIDMQTARN